MEKLADLIQSDLVHIAKEFTCFAVSSLGRINYHAAPLLGAGHCAHGTAGDQQQLLSTCMDWWWIPHVHETRGPMFVFSSDGAPIRRPALYLIFETKELDSASPMHALVKPLPLLDITVGPGNTTLNVDEKHLGKRLRTKEKADTGMHVHR